MFTSAGPPPEGDAAAGRLQGLLGDAGARGFTRPSGVHSS